MCRLMNNALTIYHIVTNQASVEKYKLFSHLKDIYGNYRNSSNDMELIIAIPKITERKLRLIRNKPCWL